MVLIHPGGFDVEAWEHARKSKLSAEEAAKALLMAAKYIREKKPLPMGLDDWLAGAFEEAVMHPGRHAPANADIGHALLVCLGLKANNRRKEADWLDIGPLFEEMLEAGMSQNKAATAIATDHGISESTAVRLWKEYKAVEDAHDAACRFEDEA